MTDTTPIAEDSKTQEVASPLIGARSAAGTRWALLLAIGGLAGAAGSEVIERTQHLFHVAPERVGMPPYPPQLAREMMLYSIANHAVGFGALGLLICGGLGLGQAALGGSRAAAVRALVLGGLLGFLMGALGGAAALLTYEALVFVELDGILKAMLIHLPNWLLLGIVIAFVTAVLRLHRTGAVQLFASAAIAGFVAAFLYPLLALLLFPAANSDRPIPFGLGLRVLCFACGGVVLGVAAARWQRPPPPVHT